jgi:uncharacterized membrane protein YhaH (DUF805 family)
MGTFTQSLANGLGGLTRFSGRDRPRLFWPYAGAVYGVLNLIMVFAMVPLLQDAIRRAQRFVVEHPDQVTVEQSPGHYSVQFHGFYPELMPDLRLLFVPMAIGNVLGVLLLAAAVVRRLHDRGKSGFLGLLPLPFLAAGMILMPIAFDRFGASMSGKNPEPDVSLIFWLFANNLLFLAGLVILIVELASGGTRGPNRFGPDPLDLERAPPAAAA